MGVTPGGISYPEDSDQPDIPAWMQQQAEEFDTAIRPRIQTGSVDISLAGAASATALVTFDDAFPAVPTVITSYGSINTVPRVWTGCSAVTTTGFTAMLATTDGTTHGGTRTVNWVAVLEA